VLRLSLFSIKSDFLEDLNTSVLEPRLKPGSVTGTHGEIDPSGDSRSEFFKSCVLTGKPSSSVQLIKRAKMGMRRDILFMRNYGFQN
jgi:hypothetical protein